ncbi:hypothetical protein AQS8620_00428 [Aquimixticola soesokkakensis]|uniref:Glycosyl transferase family 2 n=1 Tax=Aquimixticola soesokkakensis TaxID=1519096 RepID=A0A1Y5RJL5_9RHOB|nr:glycosyltransferase family 2 protein [Aquimixticola soesokkakensis]SLN19094.1 hypothetical protein AQS8620_00428 [Aquimixticola soesokkakensis]
MPRQTSVSIALTQDDGPFLLQWIAWQKALGFDEILVLHHDCTDRSPQLLRLLEREGVLSQKSFTADPDRALTGQAVRRIAKHPIVQTAHWALLSDIAQRLVIFAEAGQIEDLTARLDTGQGAYQIPTQGFAGPQALWDEPVFHHETALLQAAETPVVPACLFSTAAALSASDPAPLPPDSARINTYARGPAPQTTGAHDSDARRYDTRFQTELDKLLAIAGVARLHALCCADFAAHHSAPDEDRAAPFRKRAKSLPKHAPAARPAAAQAAPSAPVGGVQDSLVMTCTRNEGPFILEWVAWQKMLGFDDVLICYNDCTDHSPELMARLQEAGWLTALEVTPTVGKPPKLSLHKAGHAHPLTQKAGWFFLCDIDEFLVLHTEDGTLASFLGEETPNVAGIAIHWKVFGDSGLTRWEDQLTHRMFTQAGGPGTRVNHFFKSFIYQPRRFKRLGAHSPKGWQGEGPWNEGVNRWIRSNGARISGYNPDTNPKSLTHEQYITHDTAQVNHYVIRTRENYAFKQGRASASAGVDRYTDDFLRRHNRNDEVNTDALAQKERFDAVYAQIRAVPDVERLHHLCCADYVQAMCEKRGDDFRADERWQHHMAQAAALLPA